jgi:hypothetical protein
MLCIMQGNLIIVQPFNLLSQTLGKKKRTLATTQGHVNTQGWSRTPKEPCMKEKVRSQHIMKKFNAMMWIGLIHEIIDWSI